MSAISTTPPRTWAQFGIENVLPAASAVSIAICLSQIPQEALAKLPSPLQQFLPLAASGLLAIGAEKTCRVISSVLFPPPEKTVSETTIDEISSAPVAPTAQEISPPWSHLYGLCTYNKDLDPVSHRTPLQKAKAKVDTQISQILTDELREVPFRGNENVLFGNEVQEALDWYQKRVDEESHRLAQEYLVDHRRKLPVENLWKDQGQSLQVGPISMGKFLNVGTRDYMEDAAFMDFVEIQGKQYPIFGTLDGHGTSEQRSEAQDFVQANIKGCLTECLTENLENSDTAHLNDAVIYNSFTQMIQELDRDFCSKDNHPGGTTANIGMIVETENSYIVYTANIGDSRSIAVELDKTNSPTYLLSLDAKPNDPMHRRMIERSGGTVEKHKGAWTVVTRLSDQTLRLAMASSIGDADLHGTTRTVEITKKVLSKEKNHVVVSATDGVNSSPNTLGLVIKKRMLLEENPERTSAKALAEDIGRFAFDKSAGGYIDNIGVVVVNLPKASKDIKNTNEMV